MPLRPSISRAEYGTVFDWLECVEIATRKIYGTPGVMQEAWIETFLTVPVREDQLFAGADLPLFPQAAA